MNTSSTISEPTENSSSVQHSAPGTVLIENVSKRFRKATARKQTYTTVKTSLLNRWFSKTSQEAVFLQALDNISVRVEPGSSLGVVGRNGSGKSTLLKLIAGIYRPDSGRVAVSGRVSALIELGAGFHPDFTGRENVYLAGVMYGLGRKEIDERFDDIVRYAELEDFIDDPVRTYSSGMYMRLGFSVAIHTEPDILLVDEVLAVGDAAFVNRCKDTISDFRRQGRTLVFVTHDLSSVVRWCDDALWLDRGVVRKRGNPQWVIDSYLNAVQHGEEETLREDNLRRKSRAGSDSTEPSAETRDAASHEGGAEDPNRWGTKEVEIASVRMCDTAGEARWVWQSEETAVIEIEYRIKAPISELVFGIGILSSEGQVLHGTNTDIERISAPLPAGSSDENAEQQRGVARYVIRRLGLVEGSYFLDVAVHRKDGSPFDYHHRMYKFSVRCEQAHHGVWHPLHSWEFQPGYAVREHSEEDSTAERE